MACSFYIKKTCTKGAEYKYSPSFFQLREYCTSEKENFRKCPFFRFGHTGDCPPQAVGVNGGESEL